MGFPAKTKWDLLSLLNRRVRYFTFSGDYELIQRSVALCRDDFIASRMAALAENFGAKIGCFAIANESLTNENWKEAREFVERVLKQRLHQRGRRR